MIRPEDICPSEYQLYGDDAIRCTLPIGHPGEHQAFLFWVNEEDDETT